MKKHREIKVPEEPFIDWVRKRYTGSKNGLNPPDLAELETDRDLGKPIEQLLCDAYEGYTYWLKLKSSPDTPEEMKKPIQLILYTMVRTASMNAVVAKESTTLQKSIKNLTRWLWIFTIILVLMGAIQLWVQLSASDSKSPVVEMSDNLKQNDKTSPRLSHDEIKNKNTSNNRLEQMAGKQAGSEDPMEVKHDDASKGTKQDPPATAQP